MQKTCHTILKTNQLEDNLLQSWADLHAKALHTALSWICKENKVKFNQKNDGKLITSLTPAQKTKLQNEFVMNSRHVNSINIELGGMLRSFEDTRILNFNDSQDQLKALEKKLSRLQEENISHEKNYPSFKVNAKYFKQQINAYQQFLIKQSDVKRKNKSKISHFFVFKADRQSCFKNILNASQHAQLKKDIKIENNPIINKDLFKATQAYAKNLYQLRLIKHKIHKLKAKINRLHKDMVQGKIRMCFGSKKLFKQQHLINDVNPSSRVHKNHIDWLLNWYEARAHQIYLTGAGEQTQGNLNAQAVLNQRGLFDLKLRLPDALVKKYDDNLSSESLNKNYEYLILKDIKFMPEFHQILIDALKSEKQTVKVQSDAEKAEIKQLKEQRQEIKDQIYAQEKKLLKINNHYDFENILDDDLKHLYEQLALLENEISTKSNITDLTPFMDNDGKLTCSTRSKRVAIPVTYQIIKNIDQRSPKYGKWSLHFTVNMPDADIITDMGLGTIGIDLNQNHLAVSEIDASGNLIQSVNVYLNGETYSQEDIDQWETKQIRWMNTNNQTVEYVAIKVNDFKFAERIKSKEYDFNQLSTDKAQIVLGKALTIVTDWAKRVGKPIVIEKLDFAQKKRQLKTNNAWVKNKFNYNQMISSFAYGKFKELLKSQCARKGIELKETNPAFSSLIGMVHHANQLGLSNHMAASYVIAKRGLIKKKKFQTLNDLLEQPDYQNSDSNQIQIFFQGQVYLIACTASNSDVGALDSTWAKISQTCQNFKKAYFKAKAKKISKSCKPSTAPAFAVDPFTHDRVPNLIPHNPGIQ